jgi:hypothetical protein
MMISPILAESFAYSPAIARPAHGAVGAPPLTMRARGGVYEVSAALNGVCEDDIMAHVSGRVLTILGIDPMADDEEAPAVQHVVLLPPDASMAGASVRCADGRFILAIPRR